MKAGTKVVCIKKQKWATAPVGPKFNEVCTIERFSNNNSGFLVFIEYQQTLPSGGRHAYNYIWFEPLITDAQLQKELETIEQFV